MYVILYSIKTCTSKRSYRVRIDHVCGLQGMDRDSVCSVYLVRIGLVSAIYIISENVYKVRICLVFTGFT